MLRSSALKLALCESTATSLLAQALTSHSDHYEDIIMWPIDIGRDMGGIWDWNISTVPQPQLDGNTRTVPMGRVVGGGSILNGMLWNRGNQEDYNDWANFGNPGWGWSGLLPYFKKVSIQYSTEPAEAKR